MQLVITVWEQLHQQPQLISLLKMVRFAQQVITAHSTLMTLGVLNLFKLTMTLVLLLLVVPKLQFLVLPENTIQTLVHSCLMPVLLALLLTSVKGMETQQQLHALMDGTASEKKRSQSPKARSVPSDLNV